MQIRFSVVLLLLLVVAVVPAAAKTTTFHLDEVYSIAPDGTLFIYTSDADVLIAGSDRDDVHVVVDYVSTISGVGLKVDENPFEVEVLEEDGDLRIRELESNRVYMGLFVSSRTDYTVTIEAPSSVKLKVIGEDDDYMIHGFRNGIRLRMEDGRAKLRDMSGDSFEFELEDGTIEMSGGAGLLDVSVEDGDFYVDDAAFTSATGDVEDGDLHIETTLADDGEYRFRAEDGDITLNVLDGGGEFSVYYEDGGARATRDFVQVEEDENFALFRLKEGTARVRFRVEDGRISLRAK
ncbi:DUF4097 domain-containing protein [bacterium]|nr:DUF4097 domain-containing protein [bacterium]